MTKNPKPENRRLIIEADVSRVPRPAHPTTHGPLAWTRARIAVGWGGGGVLGKGAVWGAGRPHSKRGRAQT